MPVLKPSQLKSQISAVLTKVPKAHMIGFRTHNRWEGESYLTLNDKKFMISQCNSPLAFREAVLNAQKECCPLAVITNLNDPDLGDDLRALLAKRRLIPIKPWASVKELFQAKEVDPAIIRKQWLAEALLDVNPDDGFDAAPNGFLTAERVWSEILSFLIGIENARPDVKDILKWSLDDEKVARFRQLPEERQADIASWILVCSGEPGKFLITLSGKEHRYHLLVMGLACEVITSDLAGEQRILQDASIRFEKYTGDRPVPADLAKEWGAASCGVYSDLIKDGAKDVVHFIQEKLDYLLKDLGLQDHLWLSAVSLMGFEQRLIRFANELIHLLNKRNPTSFKTSEHLLKEIENHTCAIQAPERIERLRMAQRLMRWLQDQKENQDRAGNFASEATVYVRGGGFVDWARNALYRGDGCPELGKAFSRILSRTLKIRETQNEKFAELLVEWTAAGSSGDDILKVEDVLRKVVSPAAMHDRVLFIVMDGMSHAVFAELKENLLGDTAWVEITLEDMDSEKPVVALFPTVTDVCRRSLLCGKPSSDPAESEIKGFTQNEALNETTGAMAPNLFLKADLLGTGGAELAEGIKNEIYSRRKIVGAVVNAVDDFLYKGDQLAVSWKVEKIPVLEKLIYAAREADRTVIITSDHGHVLDHKSKCHKYENGERWRSDDGVLHHGEIRIRGSRVLKPDTGEMIAPWSEKIRYGSKKNGYHGGLTPQEVLVPLLVMKWRPEGKKWHQASSHEPHWWNCEINAAPMPSRPEYKAGPATAKSPSSIEAMPLFAEAAKTHGPSKKPIIDRLMGSPVLVNQKKMCGRAAPTDEKIRSFLETLDQHGGTMLQPALAQATNQPLFRFRGIISIMQRILNVDGYPVLSFDTASNTISINYELMQTQFEI
jgi:hypothetical protein